MNFDCENYFSVFRLLPTKTISKQNINESRTCVCIFFGSLFLNNIQIKKHKQTKKNMKIIMWYYMGANLDEILITIFYMARKRSFCCGVLCRRNFCFACEIEGKIEKKISIFGFVYSQVIYLRYSSLFFFRKIIARIGFTTDMTRIETQPFFFVLFEGHRSFCTNGCLASKAKNYPKMFGFWCPYKWTWRVLYDKTSDLLSQFEINIGRVA